MCSNLAFFVAVCLAGVVSTNGQRASCRQVSNGNGDIVYDCASVVPQEELTAQNSYILWLKSQRENSDHNIVVNLPHYKIEDLLQAAAKGGESKSHTNINVNLKSPEISHTAQKDDAIEKTSHTFDVNLLYERLLGKSVHFGDEGPGERYSPLKKKIPEPGEPGTPGGAPEPDYTDLIQKLIRLMGGVFREVGEIAVADNPEVGQSIINTLNGELGKANRIYENYLLPTSGTTNGRRKRDAGSDALSGVKGVAKGAGGAVEGDASKLSPGAKGKTDKSLKKLAKCADSDACINTAKDLTSEGSEQ